jgi:16S rRNA (cytidine1402-2'-O)-methyltransferase
MSNNDAITSAVHAGLWLVATPIGNLEDLSPRAAGVLRAATIICCEDTRHSGSLLKRIGAAPERLVVANEHTEHDAIETVLTALASGAIVAVISDAGTPAISDPGERLVRAAIDAGHRVHSTPGPVAFVMAAAMSGLPTARIAFDGFLPRSGSERRERLTEVSRERRTTVLYEAPHRLERTLIDLAEACGPDRQVVLAREMTKLHEDYWRGTLADAVVHAQTVAPRGEYALVIGPAVSNTADVTDFDIASELGARTGAGLSTRDAIDEVTNALGVARKRVYAIAVEK